MSSASRPGFDRTTLTLLLSLGVCWSLVTPLARVAGTHGIPFLFFPAVAATGGALVIGAICRARGEWPPLTPAHLRLYLLAGTFGHALPQISLFLTVQHVPVGVVGLLISLTPLVTFALSLVAKVEGFSRGRALGLGLGFLGALCVLVPRGALPEPGMVPYALMGLAIPLIFATSNVWSVAWRPKTGSAMTNAFGMLVVSGGLLWLAVPFAGHGYLPNPSAPTAGDAALFVNALVAGAAFIFYFRLLDHAGPVVMSFVSFLNLGIVTLIGIVFFAERPSAWLLLAGALIVAGLIVVQRSAPAPARG
jgi:drug/metabolite transporter (DMT)-like permease